MTRHPPRMRARIAYLQEGVEVWATEVTGPDWQDVTGITPGLVERLNTRLFDVTKATFEGRELVAGLTVRVTRI